MGKTTLMKKQLIQNIKIGQGWIRTNVTEVADLQSAPFNHSGTYPNTLLKIAEDGIRTRNLRFTKPLLYR
jgi:hypothetical protein